MYFQQYCRRPIVVIPYENETWPNASILATRSLAQDMLKAAYFRQKPRFAFCVNRSVVGSCMQIQEAKCNLES